MSRSVIALVGMRTAAGVRSPWPWATALVLGLLTVHELTLTGPEASGLIRIGDAGHDAPLTLAWLTAVLCLLLLPIVAVTVGRLLAEDRDTGFLGLLLSTPLSDRGYLLGLWVAGAILSALAAAGILAGGGLAWALLPGEFLRGTGVAASGWAAAVILVPNVMVFTILLTVCGRRRAGAAVGTGALLAIAGVILSGLVSDWTSKGIGSAALQRAAVLLEPTGTAALVRHRLLSSAAVWDGSSLLHVPLLAWNRGLWLVVAASVATLSLARGRSLVDAAVPRRRPLAWQRIAGASIPGPAVVVVAATLLAASQVAGNFAGNLTARGQLPTTGLLLREGLAGFSAPIVLATIVLAGHWVWRHRETGFATLRDATATPALHGLRTVAGALGLAQFAFLVAIGAVVSFVSQAAAWPMDWGAIAFVLARHGASLVLVGALALAGSCLGRSRMGGAALCFLGLLAGLGLADFLGARPAWTPFAVESPAYAGIWGGLQGRGRSALLACEALGLAAVVLVATARRWPWGPAPAHRPRSRAEASRGALASALGALVAAGAVVLLQAGGTHAAGEKSLVAARGAYESAHRRAADDAARPRLAAVRTRIDLTPQSGVRVEGSYAVQNPGPSVIDELTVSLLPVPGSRVEYTLAGRTVVPRGSDHGLVHLPLSPPLAAGGRVELAFVVETRRAPSLLAAGWPASPVSGAFVTSFLGDLTVFPQLGYRRELEPGGEQARQRMGLGPARDWTPESAMGDDPRVTRDRVWLEVEVLAPADLEVVGTGGPQRSESTAEGRSWWFRPAEPVRFEIALVAGRFESRSARLPGLTLAVHGPPGSGLQVGRVLAAAEQAAAAVTELMQEVPASRVDIVAVPAEAIGGSSALSKPGVVFLDEAGPFAAAPAVAGSADPLVATLAHELMHQWFGHRLRPPAHVAGAVFVNEFPAQFARLWAIRRGGGEPALRRFLDEEARRQQAVEALTGQDREPLCLEDSTDRVYARSSLALAELTRAAGWEGLARALRQVRDDHLDRPLPASAIVEAVAGALPGDQRGRGRVLLTAPPHPKAASPPPDDARSN